MVSLPDVVQARMVYVLVVGCAPKLQQGFGSNNLAGLLNSGYKQKVDNFLIIFDGSSSMWEKYNGTKKFYQARNVVLFLGDAAGIPTLHLASIYRYDHPQKLYVHQMPHIALMDTSTSDQWVTSSDFPCRGGSVMMSRPRSAWSIPPASIVTPDFVWMRPSRLTVKSAASGNACATDSRASCSRPAMRTEAPNPDRY